ncbi:MAG TPA: spore coat protein [Ruminococcaceae bacterium]|nr:spore coat protein [Oscillospiraceae bacterium]
MMQDKTMVNDILSGEKNDLASYATAISECANPQLRSTLQQIRNNCEASQFELFQLAQSKGYYKPSIQATDNEVQQVKMQLQG